MLNDLSHRVSRAGYIVGQCVLLTSSLMLIGCYLGQVLYVDYGNKEVVSKDHLRVLDAEFMTDPVYCYRCRLHDVVPVTHPS